MAPTVRRLQGEGYKVRSVDVRYNPQQAMRAGVRSIPTFVLIANGHEVARHVGDLSADRLRNLCRGL